MSISLQYITDLNGNKQSVVIPFSEWQQIEKMLNKMRLLEQLKESLIEIKQAKLGKKTLSTLSSFLDECQD